MFRPLSVCCYYHQYYSNMVLFMQENLFEFRFTEKISERKGKRESAPLCHRLPLPGWYGVFF
mgnify:CR=1 FL=1